MKKHTVLIAVAILGLLLVLGNRFEKKENGWYGISNGFQTAENGALG
ncbi:MULTISPECIES: hypothetical protein [Bacillus amyloliquefaciens group]|nr:MULTISPECIES: hypothetical protein [Bacillus amyloliquefaciens group]WFP05514.1 hypothetical protein JEQ22_20090 [Bacillus velezensis]